LMYSNELLKWFNIAAAKITEFFILWGDETFRQTCPLVSGVRTTG
jgi:hypothetical protein